MKDSGRDGVLDYDDCHLSDDGAEALAEVAHCGGVLPPRCVGDMPAVSQVLRGNKSVTELLVSDNNITEEGGGALAKAV